MHLQPGVAIWYSKQEMNKAAESTTKSSSEPGPAVLGTILLDLLDTAWRIAVPVLLFAVLGIFADKQLHMAPVWTLSGVVVGFYISYRLVKKQLDAVNEREQS